MKRQTVNLVISKTEDPTLHKLKIILPLIAAISLSIFVIIFMVSIIYVNSNIKGYNQLKAEAETLEKRIASVKNSEGIYTLTSERLRVIKELTGLNRNFYNLVSKVDELQSGGINIYSAVSDGAGSLSLSLTASSASDLDNIVTQLLSIERAKLFAQMQASGILREKTGNYLLNVNLKVDKSIFK